MIPDSPKPCVLVAPLDWGLGHAARCIPIVNELLAQGWDVSLAGSGNSISLLQKEFPQLTCFSLKGYEIFYHSATGVMGATIAWQIPKILGAIIHEQKWLQQLLATHHFDVVMSDNRYGLFAKNTYSVFITHQLSIRSGIHGWIDKLLQRLSNYYIGKFNECWIPDFKEEPNIAGKLSHPRKQPLNTSYIGLLSRFSRKPITQKYDLAIVLSGPEPRRTYWERQLLAELAHFEGKVLLVRGVKDQPPLTSQPNIDIADMMCAQDLNTAVLQSEWVICRSGYTSVMDLIKLDKKAILVPTPGQPEQEYLAAHLHEKGIFFTVSETRFSLTSCLQQARVFSYRQTSFVQNPDLYKQYITGLTNRVKEKLAKAAG